MLVNSEELRNVMRNWATGVTVVSAEYEGVRHGMTVSSFTSLSLSPPLVLVSLEKGTQTHRLVQAAGHFGVTILGQEQAGISDIFAGRKSDSEDRFAGLETFTLVSGAPILRGGLGGFDCKISSMFDAGTQTVFIGEVLAVQNGGQASPLIYFDRSYRKLELDDGES